MGNQTNIKNGLMIVAFLLVMAGSARSQYGDYVLRDQYTGWVSNGIGNWSNDHNWDRGEPTNGMLAGIGFGGTVQITEVGEECDVLWLLGQNVEMSSGSLLVIKEESIGGAFTQTGGVHWSHGYGLILGYYTEGTYNLSGEGELYASGELIGYHGTGTFIQSAGTHTVEGTLYLAYEDDSIGSYALSGGTLSAGTIEFGAGVGAFNFNAGRLSVGTFEGNLYNYGGTLAPGSPGGSYPRFTCIEGNYQQQSTGVLEIELGGTKPGIQYDKLSVTGALTLNGTLNVVLINGFNPQVGDQFFILDFNPAQFAGSFATIDLPDLPEGLFWDTTQLYTTGWITAQRKRSTRF